MVALCWMVLDGVGWCWMVLDGVVLSWSFPCRVSCSRPPPYPASSRSRGREKHLSAASGLHFTLFLSHEEMLVALLPSNPILLCVLWSSCRKALCTSFQTLRPQQVACSSANRTPQWKRVVCIDTSHGRHYHHSVKHYKVPMRSDHEHPTMMPQTLLLSANLAFGR